MNARPENCYLKSLASSFAAILMLAGMSRTLLADAPRVLPPGKLPADKRLAEPKDLNGYFPLQVPATAAD